MNKTSILDMHPVVLANLIANKALFALIVVCLLGLLWILLRFIWEQWLILRHNKKLKHDVKQPNINEWQLFEKQENSWWIDVTKQMLSITRSKMSWKTFLLIVLAWGLGLSLIAIVVFKNWKAALPMFIMGIIFPYIRLYAKVLKQREIFLKQFLPTISAFTSVYQTTKNRALTILEIKDKLPEEMSYEFNLMANKINSSIPVSECVEEFARRVNNKWAYAFATVVAIPDKVGGDIEEALVALTDKVAAEQINIGEMTSSKQYVKSTFTALLFLQAISALVSFIAFPDAYRIFTETTLGQISFFLIALCDLISLMVLVALSYKG